MPTERAGLTSQSFPPVALQWAPRVTSLRATDGAPCEVYVRHSSPVRHLKRCHHISRSRGHDDGNRDW